MRSLRSSYCSIPKMNSLYYETIKELLQQSTDIFGFRMAKLSALKTSHKVKNSNLFLNLKISAAIIRHPHLKSSLLVIIVTREKSLSQRFYLGPKFNFMKFCGKR